MILKSTAVLTRLWSMHMIDQYWSILMRVRPATWVGDMQLVQERKGPATWMLANVDSLRWSWEFSNSWVLLHPLGQPEVLLGTHLHMHGKSREITSREALQVAHSSSIIKVRSWNGAKVEGFGIHVPKFDVNTKWNRETWAEPEWIL